MHPRTLFAALLLSLLAPAAFAINNAPIASAATYTLPAGRTFEAILTATDSDLPAQTLTWRLSSPPTRGEAVVSSIGRLRYTPAPGRFGPDLLGVIVNDGETDSLPAIIELRIRPAPVTGDLFLSIEAPPTDAVWPADLDYAEVIGGGSLTSLRALAWSKWSSRLYAIDGEPGTGAAIVEVEPLTGTQRRVLAGAPLIFPMGLAASDDGFLYIANAPAPAASASEQGPGAQILRLNLRTHAFTVLAEGDALQFPTGLALGPDGALYCLDAGWFALDTEGSPADARLLRLDLGSLELTVRASGPLLQDPLGLLALDDGTLLVTEVRGDILKVEGDGTTSALYEPTDGAYSTTAIVRDPAGEIYAAAFDLLDNSDIPPTLLRLRSLAPADTEIVLQGDYLGEAFGLAALSEYPDYATWLAAYFSAEDRANPEKETTVWGDRADPDADGLVNLLEFALGRSPLGSDNAQALLAAFLKPGSTGDRLAITLNRRVTGENLQYALQASDDLSTWTTLEGGVTVSDSGASLTLEDNVDIGSTPRRFIRLHVSRP